MFWRIPWYTKKYIYKLIPFPFGNVLYCLAYFFWQFFYKICKRKCLLWAFLSIKLLNLLSYKLFSVVEVIEIYLLASFLVYCIFFGLLPKRIYLYKLILALHAFIITSFVKFIKLQYSVYIDLCSITKLTYINLM